MSAVPQRVTTTSRPVPLLDLARQNGPLEEEIRAALDRVCSSGQFILGPDVSALEEAIADYCGTRFAVGCASGSDALLLALLAYGIGQGDEVIVPSFTFFATASAVFLAGAKPVFVDIEPKTFGLDPEGVRAAITSKTKAIIPVHLYGQCCEMGPILQLAEEHGLKIIEDAAQSIGAEYHGKRAGSIGDVGCLSFYPTKNLGCFGDGGMLVTSDEETADRLNLLRVHGMRPRYHHRVVGINSRLASLQAAVLRCKLPHLDSWTEARASHAQRYPGLFAEYGITEKVQLPQTGWGRRHVWNQYVIRVTGTGRRDALRAFLHERGIGTEVYYPIPLHQQDCFAQLPDATRLLPETMKAAEQVLALPVFPELTSDEQRQVVEGIAEFFATH
jgi:dTDP-4-amino-4,6-dideoxygalactose transaminase